MSATSTLQGHLAIFGGPKAVSNQLAGWPQFDENAIGAVEQVLRSGKVNYWTGPQGMEFERRFAQWQGSRFAVSTATGTSALHVCLAALGIGPGDEVIVPSYTFIATSFAVVQAGAIPRFADVNLDDHCISVASAEKLITRRTKAIIPVHLYGNVCDMDEILAFAARHRLYVIEDNAEAFGGVYKGKRRARSAIWRLAVSARTRPSRRAAKGAWSPPTTRISPGKRAVFATTATTSKSG